MKNANLVCYRGVNENTNINTHIIKEKCTKAAIYLASNIMENIPAVKNCNIDIIHLQPYKENEKCKPISGYGQLIENSDNQLLINTSLYIGVNERIVAKATIAIECAEKKKINYRFISDGEVESINIELENIFKKYSTLNMRKIFNAYTSECKLDEAPNKKDMITLFEQKVIQNFISFAQSSTGVLTLDTSPKLSIEQNLKLVEGSAFLKETFCLNP